MTEERIIDEVVLREYLSDPFARRALRRFPLSLRRPAVAASVLALRLFA